MPKIKIDLTIEEHQKLAALALATGYTIEQCIKVFAQTCGGSSWKHPSVKAVKNRKPEIHDATPDLRSKPSKHTMATARKRMKASLSR